VRGKPVDLEAEVRQNVVIDDIVEKYGIRIECVPRQDDAIIEIFAFAADNPSLL
jgi:hypothetical protein